MAVLLISRCLSDTDSLNTARDIGKYWEHTWDSNVRAMLLLPTMQVAFLCRRCPVVIMHCLKINCCRGFYAVQQLHMGGTWSATERGEVSWEACLVSQNITSLLYISDH